MAAVVPALLAWFAKNARDLPWRRTFDPYAIWVSEIMLQQTQVKTVLPYWERWMRVLPTIAAAAEARPQRVHKLWEGLGYYVRVRNLQQAARLIVRERAGRFPERFEEVLLLPGIGRYTAGAICSIAYDEPAPILDGNVIRVLTRLFGEAGNPREKRTNARLWQLAQELVLYAETLRSVERPRPCSHLNQALMELGALVCTPRKPNCPVCPVTDWCEALRQNRVADLPNLSPRVEATPRRFVAFVLARNERWLVRRRPAGVVNALLWEFPNIEVGLGHADLASAARELLGFRPARMERLFVIKHSITRYRIRLEVVRIAPPPGFRITAGVRWVNGTQARRLPFTSAHKLILRRLTLTTGLRQTRKDRSES